VNTSGWEHELPVSLGPDWSIRLRLYNHIFLACYPEHNKT